MAAETLSRGGLPRVNWAPVIAGVLCALAAHVVLGLFGAAFGFAARPADSSALGVLAGIWGILVPLVASFIGAWVAVRIAHDAQPASAYLDGAMVWCIGIIAGAVFLASALGTGALTAGSAASGNAPLQALSRRDTPANRARASETADDAARGAAAGAGAAGIAALFGLGGAIAGAAVGRRMLTGEGLRRGHARGDRTREATAADERAYREQLLGSDVPREGSVFTTTSRHTEVRPDDPTVHH
ncbi:hypothetical protein [Anaeromyxobacter paludicola]|uniref:Uncharacterized protein n=1 Tax=Anaeromyxobacter paludicola TaxID=2918171 RepID=A0ABM7X8B3_9BACT|nr:hypothetical protein [Anaeromyxobacter paludicola]BDG08090.1 hypothetical protein AMPC_12030 [Anaeromyxobacter paludicola]